MCNVEVHSTIVYHEWQTQESYYIKLSRFTAATQKQLPATSLYISSFREIKMY